MSFIIPEFGAHYKKHIEPYVEELEDSRASAIEKSKRRKTFAIRASIAIVMAGVAALLATGDVSISKIIELIKSGGKNAPKEMVKAVDNFMSFLISFSVVGLIFLPGWVMYPRYSYKRNVKEKIVPAILKFFGDDLEYSISCPVRLDDYRDFGIVPSYDGLRQEDYITGKYKGVGFEVFEAKLTESDSSNKTIVIFEGVVVILEMNKNFSGKTLVRSDSAGGRGLHKLFSKLTKVERVELEDPKFEKIFDVYSSDQIEARYLLTTSFMERLLEFASIFSSRKSVECAFYKNKMLAFVPNNQDMFEPSVTGKVDFERDINMILQEIGLIFKMIDTLKLDLDIYGKNNPISQQEDF